MESAAIVPNPRPPGVADRSSSRRSWRDLLLICLGLKCLLFSLGVVVAEIRFNQPVRTLEWSFGIWHRWDSLHYLDIARNGYGPPETSTTLVLPPLLPLLIRAAGALTGSLMVGAVLVATLISFLPALLLFELARCDLNEEDAFRASLVLLLFPTSFFLHIVYTEGLFLTVVQAAFLAARRGRFGVVALFGLLAGLTRINAFVLVPALLVEAWAGPPGRRPIRLMASLSVGLGILVYLGINYATTGDPFAFLLVQKQSFYRTFAWPWQGAAKVWTLAGAGGTNSMMNGVLQTISIPLLLFVCVVSALRQRLSYAIWTIGNTLVFTAQDFWLSLPRLALVLFPAFIWLAPRTRDRVWGTLWFAASILFLSFFAGQFAQGWWVS